MVQNVYHSTKENFCTTLVPSDQALPVILSLAGLVAKICLKVKVPESLPRTRSRVTKRTLDSSEQLPPLEGGGVEHLPALAQKCESSEG